MSVSLSTIRPTLMRFLFTKTEADLFLFENFLQLQPYEKAIGVQKQNYAVELVKIEHI
jgi:hypothetical protein